MHLLATEVGTLDEIEAAVAAAERRTSAEVVVVLAGSSGYKKDSCHVCS